MKEYDLSTAVMQSNLSLTNAHSRKGWSWIKCGYRGEQWVRRLRSQKSLTQGKNSRYKERRGQVEEIPRLELKAIEDGSTF